MMVTVSDLFASLKERTVIAPLALQWETSRCRCSRIIFAGLSYKLLIALGFIIFLSGCIQTHSSVSMPGVENFHRVNASLYRGAQPDDEGFKNLAKTGVKTVINLRLQGEPAVREEAVVRATGMKYIGLPMANIDPPTPEEMEAILAVIRSAPAPVFVHCRRGADRTGIVVACYRIENEGWSNAAALREAQSHGMYRFLFGMRRLVLDYKKPAPVLAPASAGIGR